MNKYKQTPQKKQTNFQKTAKFGTNKVDANVDFIGAYHKYARGKPENKALSTSFALFHTDEAGYLDFKREGRTITHPFETRESRRKVHFQKSFTNRFTIDCDNLLTDRWIQEGKPVHWFAQYVLTINYSQNGSDENPRGHIDIFCDHWISHNVYEEYAKALHWWLTEQSLIAHQEDRAGIDVNRFFCNPVGGKLIHYAPGARLPIEVLEAIYQEWREIYEPINVPEEIISHENVALGYITKILESQANYTLNARPGHRHGANFLMGIHGRKAWNSGYLSDLPQPEAQKRIFQDYVMKPNIKNGAWEKYGEREIWRTFSDGWERINGETYQVPVIAWESLVDPHDSEVKVPKGEYLSDQLSLDMFLNQKTVLIATTGVGKTHFFGKLPERGQNVILIESLNAAQIQLSAQYGLSMYNSLHKDTTKLHSGYTTSYESFPKLWRMLEEEFEQSADDWLIVCDEYHTFVIDSYRTKKMLPAWELVNEMPNVVLMSGTFTYILGMEESWRMMEVESVQREQKAEIVVYGEDRNARAWALIKPQIMNSSPDVLHVIYLENKRKQLLTYVEDLRENGISEIMALNSETKTKDEVRKHLETGYIPHRVMFCTTTAREAISIHNKKVHVHIIGIKDHVTLQQFVNRFRFGAPKVTIYVRKLGVPVITIDRHPQKWSAERALTNELARQKNLHNPNQESMSLLSSFIPREKRLRLVDKLWRLNEILFSMSMYSFARNQVMKNPVSVVRTLRERFNWVITAGVDIINEHMVSQAALDRAKVRIEMRMREIYDNTIKLSEYTFEQVTNLLHTIKTEEDAEANGFTTDFMHLLRAMKTINDRIFKFFKRKFKKKAIREEHAWETTREFMLYAGINQIDLTSATRIGRFLNQSWYQLLRHNGDNDIIESLLSKVEEGARYTIAELHEFVLNIIKEDPTLESVFDPSTLTKQGRFNERLLLRFWGNFVTLSRKNKDETFTIKSKWALDENLGMYLPPPTDQMWLSGNVVTIEI